jgi:flagellar biogenesis protein FliO
MRALRVRPFLVATVLALVAAVLTPVAALAQESTDVGAAVTSFGLGDWLGLMARLALVVAVIWVAVMAMRWWVRRMQGGGSRGALGALEVIETHALGPNRALHLVRLGDRAVLVGATQERITQLMTVEDPAELKRLLERPEAPERPVRTAAGMSILSSFRTGLTAMLEQRRQVAERARAARTARASSPREAQRESRRESQAARRLTSRAASQRTAPAPAPVEAVSDTDVPAAAERPSRLAALRGAFGRRQPAPPPPPAPETRQSLFDRTLASIEAIEVAAPAPTAAGLRARDGYGRTDTAPRYPRRYSPRRHPSHRQRAHRQRVAARSRDAQIADLQRAIAAARKQAG